MPVFNDPVSLGSHQFYAWTVHEADKNKPTEFYFGCVTDDAFYVSASTDKLAKRIAQSNRLQVEHPRSVFTIGKTIELRTLTELRCTKSGDRLEMVKDGRVVHAITDDVSRQCRAMFDDIRGRRAPQASVEEGELSDAHSLSAPLSATAVVLFFGGLLIFCAYNGKQNTGSYFPWVDKESIIRMIADTLGFSGTVAVTAIALTICIFWVLVRRINPVVGDVVKLG